MCLGSGALWTWSVTSKSLYRLFDVYNDRKCFPLCSGLSPNSANFATSVVSSLRESPKDIVAVWSDRMLSAIFQLWAIPVSAALISTLGVIFFTSRTSTLYSDVAFTGFRVTDCPSAPRSICTYSQRPPQMSSDTSSTGSSSASSGRGGAFMSARPIGARSDCCLVVSS